ncbi:Homeobox protein HD-2 [Dictyocoela muelleri]|nr:Homeobox protein HD-2 [Dictyocoela muelleri]
MSDLSEELINALNKLSSIDENTNLENPEIEYKKILNEIFEIYKQLKDKGNEENIHNYEMLIFSHLEELKNKFHMDEKITEITNKYLYMNNIYINEISTDIKNVIAEVNSESDMNLPSSNRKSKNRRTNYSKSVSKTLKNWLREHIRNPYPTEAEKLELCKITGLDHTQINNWFINARRRILPLMKKNLEYE